MAECEEEVGAVDKNDLQQSDHDADDDKIPETSGWLMKRSKLSHKWKRQWFHLKNTDLFYGDSSQVKRHFTSVSVECLRREPSNVSL